MGHRSTLEGPFRPRGRMPSNAWRPMPLHVARAPPWSGIAENSGPGRRRKRTGAPATRSQNSRLPVTSNPPIRRSGCGTVFGRSTATSCLPATFLTCHGCSSFSWKEAPTRGQRFHSMASSPSRPTTGATRGGNFGASRPSARRSVLVRAAWPRAPGCVTEPWMPRSRWRIASAPDSSCLAPWLPPPRDRRPICRRRDV